MGGIRFIQSPLVKQQASHASSLSEQTEYKPHPYAQETLSHGQQDLPKSGLPQFVRHEESTTIELFYDLFFVANLTTFTYVHEINSRKALTSYIGFFCVLWFTWCQTSLFDVRFLADSWLQRFAKLCHLGIMVGLSVVGPHYDTEGKTPEQGKKDSSKSLKILALVLVVSRFILALQYCLTAFQLRKYQKAKLPVLLHSATNIIASILYLIVGLVFSNHNTAYRAFYVIAAAEMVFLIIISSLWKVCSFKGTHLVERMSLLTLYILGEGAIDILKSCGKLSKVNDGAWSGSTVGIIMASISALYLMYMLYFDCLNHKHFGSIRQQIWSFLHFPFHAVLVLSVTGMAQLISWHKVIEAVTPLSYAFESLLLSIPAPDSDKFTLDFFKTLAEGMKAIVDKTVKTYPPIDAKIEEEITKNLEIVENLFEMGNMTSFTEFFKGINDTVLYLSSSVFQTYGFEAGGTAGKDLTAENEFRAGIFTMGTLLVYFFIAAGLTLIILGILSLIMDTHYSWRAGTLLRFASHFVVGLIVTLVSITAYTTRGVDLLISPWIVPIYTFAIGIVLIFHHIKWGKGDKEHDVAEYSAPEQQH